MTRPAGAWGQPSGLSVWCTHPPGITRHSASQHRVCEQRQKKGQLPPCSCEHHGGHEAKEESAD